MVRKQTTDSVTNLFELALKRLKLVDRSAARHHREDHNATLFVKISSEERSSAMRLDGSGDCRLLGVLDSDSDSDSDCAHAPVNKPEPQ